MSHDMRTPLNGITGLLKINENHFDDIDLVKENHKKMQIAADYLLSLINEVLQMRMNAHLAKPLNMEKVIRTIYEQCRYKLSGRQQNKKT